MSATRVTCMAAVFGTVAISVVAGCRKGSTDGKGPATAGAKALSTDEDKSTNAKMWVPPFAAMAVTPAGTLWAAGRIYSPFDFGSGMVSSSGGADIYLTKVDPLTCRSTETFSFGGTGGKDQVATGVAVSANGNVGLIGHFNGEIEFTANKMDGAGPNGKPGTAGLDFLQGGASVGFYVVVDGASRGTHVTPIKARVVNMGAGALLSVGSNPTQNAFAICGKSDKAVASWNDAGAPTGVITGGKAVAGGGMDIVVAKIDAITGVVIWGKQFGGDGEQVCESVTIDNNGDVIIAGGYSGTLSFGQLGLPKVADIGLALPYVAKLNGATGAPVAARTWGRDGRSNAYGLAVDADGNIILAGTLGGDIDFGGGISITNYGWTDAFVVKLSPALAPVWAKSFGDSDYDQGVKSVGVSSKGNVIIAGAFQGSLGALGLASASKTAADGFTAELAAADGAILSAQAFGDTVGVQAVGTVTVARAATGALANATFIGGTFSSTIRFGSTTLNSGGSRSLASFIARLVP